MHLRAWKDVMPLRRPFTISAGSMTTSPGLFVALEHDGLQGFGEAAPSLRVSGETIEGAVAFHAAVGPVFQDKAPGDYAGVLETLDRAAPCNPAAKAALDMALLDLAGKARGEPVHALLGLEAASKPTSATISLDEPEAMAKDARDAVQQGFTHLKLKLGDADIDADRVKAVRDAVPEAKVRVDANTAWTEKQASDLVGRLHKLEVELVEQPLPAGLWDAMQRVTKAAEDLPVLADEDVLGLRDLQNLVERRYADGFVLKLMKCGGLWQAKRMLSLAQHAELKVMVGCMVESSLAISAASQLLSRVDWADLDGAWLLARDPWMGARIEHGTIATPEGLGLGAVPRA